MSITIELTVEEAQTALNLWEAGLKAAGDSAADAYVHLRNKLRDAANSPPSPSTKPAKRTKDAE